MRLGGRLGLAVLLAVALAGVVLAPDARAGYVNVYDYGNPYEPPFTIVEYVDPSEYLDREAEYNTVEISVASGRLVVRDVSAGVQGLDCEQNGPSEQLCPIPELLNVRLGKGDDSLAVASIGHGRVNAFGGEGDDVLNMGAPGGHIIGGPGADTMTGGPGHQSVGYDDKTEAVEVDLTRSGPQGTPGENDELAGIEDVSGGGGDDRLTGDGADNHMGGGFGDDRLFGGDGDDTLSASVSGDGGRAVDGADHFDGGAGEDTLSYSIRITPVTVDLRQPAGQGAAGEDDSIAGIENARGGGDADALIGDDGPNTLDGGTGGDLLQGGGGNDRLLPGYAPRNPSSGGPHLSDTDGADESDGGTGVDAVDYGGREYGVTIDLSRASGQGEIQVGAIGAGRPPEGDRIVAVEQAFGGDGNDRLRGDEGANVLDGRGGDDLIESRDRAADSVLCGGGSDTAGVDTLDEVSECELVDRRDPAVPVQPGGPFEPADSIAPALVFSASNERVRVSRRGVVTFVVGPFVEDVAGLITLRARRPFLAPARRQRRMMRLGAKRFAGASGRTASVRMRLSRRSLARLKRVRKMRALAKLSLRDQAGNVTSRSYRVTLIAPRRPTHRR